MLTVQNCAAVLSLLMVLTTMDEPTLHAAILAVARVSVTAVRRCLEVTRCPAAGHYGT